MLFRPLPDGSALAISQPAHAWISGQLARAWGGAVAGVDRLPELFILAAEQHDIGWLKWEAVPTRDPTTGRPYDFVALPRDQHTALWSAGVETAAASYGPLVALLVSLHGLAIYALTPDETRTPEDLAAVRRFRAEQETMQGHLRPQTAASDAEIADQRAILLALDLMSLVICGAMGRSPRRTPPVPLAGEMARLALAFPGDDWDRLTVDPWPFREASVTVACLARHLPHGGFTDEATMRAALAAAPVMPITATLTPA
ncbi:DUF3891 family protein [Elioraea sp.]|uniref:DUF3891 family protein n=1 Tax=Elioraea sp. TaxID=2185103 RepID=UPI003F6EF8F0